MLVEIPLNDGSSFTFSQEQVKEFASLYPALDIESEVRKMRAWTLANPDNRKTRRGALRFINAWLSKAQDKAPAQGGGTVEHENLSEVVKGSMESLGYRIADPGIWVAVIGSRYSVQQVRQAFIEHAKTCEVKPTPYTILERLRGYRSAPAVNPTVPLALHGTTAKTMALRLWRDYGVAKAAEAMERAYPGQGSRFVLELERAGLEPERMSAPHPAVIHSFALPPICEREPGCDDDLGE